MIVNRRRRWAVALPPKTGSTSLLLALTHPPFSGINQSPHWHHEIEEPPPGCRVFASVRDPFARAVSLHLQCRRDDPGAAAEDFATFVDRVLIGGAGDVRHRATVSAWLGDLGPAGALRLEALHFDLVAANLSLGRPFVLPFENLGLPGGAWQKFYDEAPGAMEKVRAWGAEDFARFGYDDGNDDGSDE